VGFVGQTKKKTKHLGVFWFCFGWGVRLEGGGDRVSKRLERGVEMRKNQTGRSEVTCGKKNYAIKKKGLANQTIGKTGTKKGKKSKK